ncbi:MAG: tetratricopeptide repeat protein [Candidatus Hydrogenedentes bacterium]|nr:tetratricopeptide repeat protein [Candidatus Hydrogenedentota bacterium]
MGRKCTYKVWCLLLIVLIGNSISCSHKVDIPTTVTLVKSKLNEYKTLSQNIAESSSAPITHEKIKELRLKAESLLNECEIMLEQIGAPYIDSEEVLKLYLDVTELKGDYGKLVGSLEWYLRKNPEKGDLWVKLGRANLKKGRNYIDKAVFCFKRARTLQLSNECQAQLWEAMGDIHWELREFDQAEQAYYKSLNFSEGIWPKVGLAGLSVARGDMKTAEEKLREMGKSLQRYDVPVRMRLREALLVFDQLTKQIPDDSAHYFAYSHILYRAGRIEDAIAVANYALFLDNTNWQEWNFLGSVYLQYNYTQDAKGAFEMSIKFNENQPELKKVLEDIAKIEKTKKEDFSKKGSDSILLRKE